MDKKIYFPTEEEKTIIDKYGDLNKYLTVKAIESTILRGLKDTKTGMLDNVSKEIRDNKNIYTAICLMFPEQVEKIPPARNDANLCLRLLDKDNKDNKIYNLDYLKMFDTTATYIRIQTISKLNDGLNNNPKYRFEYQKSDLLEEIFSCNFDYMSIYPHIEIMLDKLANIEPAYLIKEFLSNKLDKCDLNILKHALNKAINTYAYKYKIENDKTKINNKILLKYIEEDKDIIY